MEAVRLRACRSPVARHALPHPHLRRAARRATPGATASLAGWVHRRRDYGKLTFIDLRDRHGITQVVIDAADAPEASEAASRLRPRVRRRVRRRGGAAPARDGEPEAADRGDRAPGRARSAILNEAKTPPFYVNEPGRADRRDAPPPVPLPRHPARGHAAPPAPAQPARPGDPRGPPRERVRRGRDAEPDQEHARGGPRLHRPEPAPAGHRLRAAAEPPAAQAAADGGGHRPLLPDRPLLPRRGPARRPPAGVHPARPRDELRRRGRP